MTRKRALALARAAVVRECPDGALPPCWPAVERGLELAIAHGIVLGMREAARIAGAFGYQWVPSCIRAEANRLARNLRGAR